MILNESAKLLFGSLAIDEIPLVNDYPIYKKTAPCGRTYYGAYWGVDSDIEKNCDLSWLEWDRNEVNVEGCYIYETMLLFRKTVGIMKSWQAQLTKDFSDEHFAILASFDDGSALIEESAPYIGFTLRFWKIREGQGPDENIDFDQPLLKIII